MASSFLRFSRSHSMTHHSRQDSSGRVISSSQRPLPDNTQHSQQTNIRAPGGIRTHDFIRGAAADLRLRPRGHWDRQVILPSLRKRAESARFLPITLSGFPVCKLVAQSPVWNELRKAMYELSFLNTLYFDKPSSHVSYSVIQFACRKNVRPACWLFMSHI